MLVLVDRQLVSWANVGCIYDVTDEAPHVTCDGLYLPVEAFKIAPDWATAYVLEGDVVPVEAHFGVRILPYTEISEHSHRCHVLNAYLLRRAKYDAAFTLLESGSIVNKGTLAMLEWEAAGRPKMWNLVEEDDYESVWIDSGYGRIAIFDGVDCHEGKYMASNSDGSYVALDKDYYGLNSYLFKAVNNEQYN